MVGTDVTLFTDAEEAWFWFINANKASRDGARIRANEGLYKRPCEPSDILKILERLHRHRRLNMHHFRIMKHYGQRGLVPDDTRPKEVLAARLWMEAMDVLGDVLLAKQIIYPPMTAEIINFKERQEAMAAW
jgi:hypothetical protein